MGALKPQLESLKAKFKDDPKAMQVEQMKMYREFGVNPLGGCMPMALQMPIWFALYRFFPAAIEFRQAGFLWATDLSSYDVFLQLPFEIPLGFGSHISLFTMLWAATTLIYTLLFSNMINIGQTIVTKNFIIDEKKILAQLEENKKKPKKKGGFQARLETAMKEQQKIQTQRQQNTQAEAKKKQTTKK